ncbi:MAG: PKD domain-containing protein, partial [Candidatus Omnitrophica bacterium]|nr:PKD domain-containing protein [Candidatus Omnitrophota bacterium]
MKQNFFWFCCCVFLLSTSKLGAAEKLAAPEKLTKNLVSTEPLVSPRCNVFTFDATGSKDPDDKKISYSWDFGDGQTSSEQTVDHLFEKSGDYEVRLTVT